VDGRAHRRQGRVCARRDGAGEQLTDRVLAALRPRMLELAREHAHGAHPYFVPPEHASAAREILGPDRLLIPEQAVVLATDPSEARRVARKHTRSSRGGTSRRSHGASPSCASAAPTTCCCNPSPMISTV
jgi:alkanesulfonate monooxygenase SsuD/methylene tetrahydromethanopterin reductase-like flavin-dependent oxidoreductase (luciferase family)